MSDNCPPERTEQPQSPAPLPGEASAHRQGDGAPADPEEARRFELWVNEPVEPCMIVRRIPAVYQRVTFKVPGATEERMLRYACNYARFHRVRLCFCPNRRWSYWVEPDGVPPKPVETKEIHGNRPTGGWRLEDLHVVDLSLADVPLPGEPDASERYQENR